MNNFKKFKVVPDLPEKLKSLLAIANNLWLTWNPEAIKLFITLDSDLWEKNQHNPIRMLGEISQEKLDELDADEAFLSEVQRVNEQLEQYLHNLHSVNNSQHVSIAYFSAEYVGLFKKYLKYGEVALLIGIIIFLFVSHLISKYTKREIEKNIN